MPHTNLKSDSTVKQLYLQNTLIQFLFFAKYTLMSILEVETKFTLESAFKPFKSLTIYFLKLKCL